MVRWRITNHPLRVDPRIIKVAGHVTELYIARGKFRLEQFACPGLLATSNTQFFLRPKELEMYFQRGLARLIDMTRVGSIRFQRHRVG